MRPFVLVVAPNPFEDAKAPAYESDFWLRTRSGHLASFSNLVRRFNPVGGAQPPQGNRWKAVRPLAGYYLESFLKTHGYDARAVFTLDEAGSWSAGSPTPVAVALSTTFITSVAELVSTLLRVRSSVPADVPIVVGGQLVWKHYLWGPDRFAGRVEVEGRPELAPLFGPRGDPVLRDATYVASEFGEHTLLRLLEALRRGARTADELSDVENLVVWTPEGWRSTSRAPEPLDLDREFTRWDVVDEMPAAMVPVRTSVGCPHQCEFCDFVAVHPRLRLRSATSIVQELRLIAARGGTSISFVDDNALSSRGRARELARAIAESELGMRWGGYLRADRVGEDEAVLLANSGLMYGWCGIESGDPEILRRMKKRSDLEAARVGIDALTGAGVQVLATFVLGFPGETGASVDASVAFLNGLRRDARGAVEYLVFPFQVAPGAPVDSPERRRELGLTGLLDRWQHPTMCSDDVRATWAPHFFRGVEASYTYYGGDNSSVWSAAHRSQAVAQRKAVTVAFLDGASDGIVQDRFAALYRTLRFTPGEPPDWRDHLAPRERQPGAAAAPSTRRAPSCDGDA
jgi:radical SAM superfamily enzyme YgiQ (UPF0313 family)